MEKAYFNKIDTFNIPKVKDIYTYIPHILHSTGNATYSRWLVDE